MPLILIRKYLFLSLLLFCLIRCQNLNPLERALSSDDESIRRVMEHAEMYEIQVLYTEVYHRGDSITLETYEFQTSDDLYFYPASTVKMPVAFLALERLNEINNANATSYNRRSPIAIDSLRRPQHPVTGDSTSYDGTAQIEHYIDKIFAVSDNDAYNRLYELLGSDYINKKHREKGIFKNDRIRHRVGVGGFDTEENRHTPSWCIGNRTEAYCENAKYAQIQDYPVLRSTQKGVAYIDPMDQLVTAPFDFSEKNFLSLKAMQGALMRVIYPQLFSLSEQYLLSPEDYQFLKESMAKRPRDHAYLQDHPVAYDDGYVKFFCYGDTKDSIPEHIKIMNKVGYAYGYLTDCAHISDLNTGKEFFLAATIHVNKNQTYNDGIYEYDSIGIPFLAQLGRVLLYD